MGRGVPQGEPDGNEALFTNESSFPLEFRLTTKPAPPASLRQPHWRYETKHRNASAFYLRGYFKR